jgi:translation initiation factor 2 subunit 3
MATMLSGAAIMDGAVLVIGANEICPQPQTKEHLLALDIVGIHDIIVIQNKVDLVGKEKAIENYEAIKKFIGTSKIIKGEVPIIPVSAQHATNLDVVIEAIEKFIPTPKRDLNKKPLALIARSFNVNRPGSAPENLIGGILGGTLVQGCLKINDEIEIRPGVKMSSKHGRRQEWVPLVSKIASLTVGRKSVTKITPGGSIGIGTYLDPAITKADSLAGSVVGRPGEMPPVWDKFQLETTLMEKVVGTKTETKVKALQKNEVIMLNVGPRASIGVVTGIHGKLVDFALKIPVCAEQGARAALSRKIDERWHLIGYGIIVG